MEDLYKPIVQESSVAAYYDLVENWFYISWFGEQKLNARMQAFEQVLDYLKIASCNKILNDNSRNTSTWHDCAYWLTHDWLPRAEASGLRTIAWVYSEDPEVRRSAEEMLNRLTGKIIIIPFEKLEDAKAWLNSV